ncbi:MAG: serine hydrolase domain-containing protein, partial [Eudoraea sp.]|uniref:serine hydrolase domain-containing protein n=1 Tax=Eudoraea sp. TaxID=1979955 RepID=UPI003C715ADE
MNLPMQSYKIFIGITITILSLLALILNGNNTRYSSESEDAISTNNSKKTIADQRAVQLYKLQQNELKVAIKAYFDKAIASGAIVGAGVSIVKGDSIVISDGFGKRNINVDTGVDGQTIFRLGSLSKGFAGILAANLKSEGKLDWEDKVSDYIPEFQLGDRSNTAKITLANIL